jgi:Na+/H+ antiporter NhaD/arsenite permease-like protein
MPQSVAVPPPELTGTWVGYWGLAIFAIAYVVVMLEERLKLRKSKPVIVAAGLIWAGIGFAYVRAGMGEVAAEAVRHNLGEYGELFLFILSAMTFVNTMEERQVFDALRAWLVRQRLSLRSVFWVTGLIAFLLSSQLDNLTTALVMGTVAITVGRGYPRFIALACINVVVAANAGGAFSPFGDITSLMVWQAGRAGFWDFFRLFLPALVNWGVPALAMSFAVPRERPHATDETVRIRRGGLVVVGLFALTIVMAVTFYNGLGLPPVLGMTTGLGLLQLYSYYLVRTARVPPSRAAAAGVEPLSGIDTPEHDQFDIFEILRRAEWDTLMFFYGIILCVGGLATLGYLAALSTLLYTGYGSLVANIAVGLISAVIDNIPVMFAVLQMNPAMDVSEWLLVTLTAGVGGSILSIGSAAGVALMGQARGVYTFFSHLKWSWAILLGYALSIWVHLLVNGR